MTKLDLSEKACIALTVVFMGLALYIAFDDPTAPADQYKADIEACLQLHEHRAECITTAVESARKRVMSRECQGDCGG